MNIKNILKRIAESTTWSYGYLLRCLLDTKPQTEHLMFQAELFL